MSLDLTDGVPNYVGIEYRNETEDPKVVVVVASRNVSEQNADSNQLVAWKILATQTRIFFRYPRATQVGAYFMHDHGTELVMSGPFSAEPGSYWTITQDKAHEAPILTQVKDSPKPPRASVSNCYAITIENVRPKTWTGRPYAVGLFKEEDLIVVNKKLNVGNHAEFELSDELLFGVLHSDTLRLGETFSAHSSLIACELFPLNLNSFPTGVVVRLTQSSGGGEYIFHTETAEGY